uniref:Uncharacterized protein n=1 Tax=Vitis vinifera TaxID=29760 RepID=F6HFW6_VITVI
MARLCSVELDSSRFKPRHHLPSHSKECLNRRQPPPTTNSR